MQVVHKYPIVLGDYPLVKMPTEAKILHFGLDANEILCIWAEVNPENTFTAKEFQIVGTGHAVDESAKRYIGTVIHHTYVWHLYELQ